VRKIIITFSILGLTACGGPTPRFTVPTVLQVDTSKHTVWVEQPMYSTLPVLYAAPTGELEFAAAEPDGATDAAHDAPDLSGRRVGVYTSRAEWTENMRSLANEVRRLRIPENMPGRDAPTDERVRFTSVSE
jgi:hypothetical protein